MGSSAQSSSAGPQRHGAEKQRANVFKRQSSQEWGGKQISSHIPFSARMTTQWSTARLGKGEKGHFNKSREGKHGRRWTCVRCQQIINLLANEKKKITTGSWESSYNETEVILNALIVKVNSISACC